MINFRALPPINQERRKEAAPKVTQLLNGANFEFAYIQPIGENWFIAGRYLDYAGQWCSGQWNEDGHPCNRKQTWEEFGLDWGTAR